MKELRQMLVLASGSPRRKELMALICEELEIIPAKGEENADASLAPEEYVKSLASAKAEEIALLRPDDTIIGADTVVVLDGNILGKPRDNDDAKRMLRQLSGKTHSVFTGTAIISEGKRISFADESKVKFYPLTEEEIESYAETGEPLDKAGAYGIQGKGALLVEKIDGDYYNVMGLPIARLYRALRQLGEI